MNKETFEKYKNHPQGMVYPGIFTCRNQPSRSLLIKYNPDCNQDVLEQQIKATVQTNYTNLFFSENDDIGVEHREVIDKMKPVFYGVVLAISFLVLNALFGFFTLIWYNVRSRTKELGIRRAVGANKKMIQRKKLEKVISLQNMNIGKIMKNILAKKIGGPKKIK